MKKIKYKLIPLLESKIRVEPIMPEEIEILKEFYVILEIENGTEYTYARSPDNIIICFNKKHKKIGTKEFKIPTSLTENSSSEVIKTELKRFYSQRYKTFSMMSYPQLVPITITEK